MNSSLQLMRENIAHKNSKLPIDPTYILSAIDSMTLFKHKELSPLHRKRIRKNIAVIFKMIHRLIEVINQTYPGALQDNIFKREIMAGLKSLKSLYDFLGSSFQDKEIEEGEIMDLKKRTYIKIKELSDVSKTIAPPKDRTEAVEILIDLNKLARFITKVLNGY